MDRAIDIKRRAQRCIQSGDLPGALAEYEKLVTADASDPYTYVLLADLLYKMGDHAKAGERYLTAASCYEQAGLYKNAIAVGKKMLRLALSPAAVLERLASLHALDGLVTEASLYYLQYAEHLVRESRVKDAAATFRKAFDICPENVKALERLAEFHLLADDNAASALVLAEAAVSYTRAGLRADAERCAARAEHMRPGVVAEFEAQAPPPPASAAAGVGRPALTPEPGLGSGAFDRGAARVVADAAGIEKLETDGPPRFVPPEDQSLPKLEIDRHSGATGAGARGGDPPGTAIPPVPMASGTPVAFDGARQAPAGNVDVDSVERLLGLAQTEFRAGNHASAAQILARAAQAYESLDRWEDALSIHRSLCKSPHATIEMIERWLANCEQRGDFGEAARVACELGDRAIQANDLGLARAWFRRATEFDPRNAVAGRRLERLSPARGPEAATTTGAGRAPAEPAPPAAEGSDGKVEVAVDRGQAVTFDFASMLAEFQRGVESQLSGDAQAHYDLAMAYREMGLIEQAIESFRLSAKDIDFRQRCGEMIGRCLLEDGRFDEAALELTQTLAFAALEPESAVVIRFQLGIALEACGRTHEALSEFERVFEIQASYPDVAVKIRELRKHLEAA